MKEKLTVYGYSGSAEELKTLLEAGLRITAMTQDGSGYVIEYDKPKVGRPQKVDKELILSLRAEGKSYAAIAKELSCSKAYVIKVCKAEAAMEPQEPVVEPKQPTEDEIPGQMHVEDYLQLEKPKKSLKEMRKAAGLTQKELSERTGIKLKTIQALERGERRIEGEIFQYYLARELHCRADELPR